MLWFDGKIIDPIEARISPADRGLLLGEGVFTTLLSLNARPYMIEEHTARVTADARRLGIAVDRKTVIKALRDLAEADNTPSIIRLTITGGQGPRGLLPPYDRNPVIFATRTAWMPSMAFGAMRLATVSIRRNATSPLASMKSLAYLDQVFAMNEARSQRADDALMLDLLGNNIASTAIANLFVMKQNVLKTPSLTGAIRPGVMRGLVLDLAHQLGWNVVEAPLAYHDLTGCDAAFTTNSLRLMTTISHIDGIELSNEARDMVTALRVLLIEHINQETNYQLTAELNQQSEA
jgi:branched-chain amino acid aminotransferase